MTGLTTAEAAASREKHGSNELSHRRRTGFFRQFLSNFGDPIIKVLLAALAINLIFMFHHFDWYESAGIAVAVFLATFVSTLSEHGSESAFEKLQEEAGRLRCRAKRDGSVVELAVGDVVVGDVILLQAGERVPADGRLIEGAVTVDQSALNGESREVPKSPAADAFCGDLSARGDLFRGSVICAGEGVMRAERVGDATFYGGVARELQEDTRESPLKLRLAGLARTISHIGYAAAILVAAADLFHALVIDSGFSPARMLAQMQQPAVVFGYVIHALTLAVTTIVVAVPEGLPMMITVVLSSNMRRMLRDHVLVRKPVGIETSGSLNILFTDKTGTLTKGQLTVSRFVDGAGTAYTSAARLRRQTGLWELVTLSGVHNSASLVAGKRVIGGNATDRALLSYVLPVPPTATACQTGARLPFDSDRKLSAVQLTGARRLTLVKGAPEKLLAACTRYFDGDGQPRPLTDRTAVRAAWHEMTARAMRVLVIAATEQPLNGDAFGELTLIGLAGIRDDVRPEARAAIAEVRRAGIQTVMITGDNAETAAAIAREAGLLDGQEDSAVLTSAALSALSDDEVKRRLPELRVVARALPTDKTRLVRLAQEQGLVVGMTGDGINDAPALKKADVGFAMGSGTEVAKEAGDIVILDDNFASIARAILYGRTIFKSIRKFIVFQLTMNLCAVGISIIGPFIGVDTPVTVMQMLWINIIMDTLAGLAFAGEPPLPEYMHEPPKRRDEPVLNRYMLNQILCTGGFTVALCVAFLKWDIFKPLFRYAGDPIYLMTAFFALFIFSGVFNSFNARTHRLNLLAHLAHNPSFVVIMTAVAAIQLGLIYFGGALFRTAGLTARELLRVMLLAFSVVPADAARKWILRLIGRKGCL